MSDRLSVSDGNNDRRAELQVPAHVVPLIEEGLELAKAGRAPNTLKAYESDWRHFVDWCRYATMDPLPATPLTIWLYLTALVEDNNAAEYSVATIERRLSAIAHMHLTNGVAPSPTAHPKVREQMDAIRRKYRAKPNKRRALQTSELRRMIDLLDLETLTGLRDRALLLVGFAGAFRRSELVGIRVADIAEDNEGKGYVISLGRTKDDQTGPGRIVGIPRFPGAALCPVTALDAWLAASDIAEGPVFRRVTRYQTVGTAALAGGTVAKIIKDLAKRAGLPYMQFSGHSLRAGHATVAAANHASDRSIMNQTGHKSVETLNGYIRPARALDEDNSARYLNLDNPGQGGS